MKPRVILLLLLMSLTAISSYGQLKVVDQSIKVNAEAIDGFTPQWPTEDADGNRNPEQALIIIEYDGFPDNQINRTVVTPNINNPNEVKQFTDNAGKQYTLLYISLDDDNLTFSHPIFGSARVTLPELKNKGIYRVILQVDKRMNIDIEPLTDFESVNVYLDHNEKKESPARFNNVTLGKHNVIFEFPDGHQQTRIIDVTAQTNKFNEVTNPDFDMRTRVPLTIQSSDRNVSIYIDGNLVASKAPFTAQLPYGTHTIKAVSNTNVRKLDITTAKIVEGSGPMTVKLNPTERRKFQVTGSYDGSGVPMMLYVGNEEAYKISQNHAKGEQRSYEFDLPIGKRYKFKATYQGNEGSRSVKVKRNMNYDQEIKIKRRHRVLMPWEREYVAPPMGLTVAYVRKQYEVKREGETVYKGDLLSWDDNIQGGGNDRWLNGVRVGAQYQPTLRLGLGIYTGIFWEYYQSSTDKYNTSKGNITNDFNKYREHSLTVPAQLFYNFPFASKVALAIHGGVSLNYMLARTYSGFIQKKDDIIYEHSYNALKDPDNLMPMYPDKLSVYWEAGLQLRLGPMMFGAQVTRPITKHKFEVDGLQYTTTAIKNSLSLTFVF